MNVTLCDRCGAKGGDRSWTYNRGGTVTTVEGDYCGDCTAAIREFAKAPSAAQPDVDDEALQP
jgi:hypothetical protein